MAPSYALLTKEMSFEICVIRQFHCWVTAIVCAYTSSEGRVSLGDAVLYAV